MDKTNFFIYILLIQILVLSLIFFLSGEVIAIIFLVMFISIDVSAIVFDFIDTRNKEITEQTHKRFMEALEYARLLKQGKSDIQVLREELALLLEKGHVQIHSTQPKQLEIKPEEGEYRIIKK